MRKVIAALDNSAAAGSVLATAKKLGAVFGAEIDAVHVGEDGDRIAAAAAAGAGLQLRRLDGAGSDHVATEAGGRRPAGRAAPRKA